MGEQLFVGEDEELVKPPESRWGNVEKVIQILSSGEIRKIIRLEDLISGIEPHTNEVDYAEIAPATDENEDLPNQEHVNFIEEMEVQLGTETLKCIFKPQKGENSRVLRDTKAIDHEMESFYNREVAAYLIDAHFGLEVVPPTIVRDIPGQGIGALRVYVDHELYDTCQNLPQGVTFENLQNSEQFQNLAALDWIIANFDRKLDDYLFRRDDPSKLVAIDNGFTLTQRVYHMIELDKIRGPHFLMTFDDRDRTYRDIPLPDSLKNRIKKGFENQEELTSNLLEIGIPQKDIEAMWARVQALLDSGKFLSRKNTQLVDLNKYQIKVIG